MADGGRRRFDEWQLLNWNQGGAALNCGPIYTAMWGGTLCWQWQAGRVKEMNSCGSVKVGQSSLRIIKSLLHHQCSLETERRRWVSAQRKAESILYTLLANTDHPWMQSQPPAWEKSHLRLYLSDLLVSSTNFMTSLVSSSCNTMYFSPLFLWWRKIWRIRKKRSISTFPSDAVLMLLLKKASVKKKKKVSSLCKFLF